MSIRLAATALPYQVQVLAECGRHYTCPAKEIDGEWFFWYKQKWNKVDDYMDDRTRITKF